MRLCVTSDLHYDIKERLTGRAAIEQMIDHMAQRPCVAIVLAGNHDLWRDDRREIGSEALWREALPRVGTTRCPP